MAKKVEHSANFDKVQRYYTKGLWTKAMVKNSVNKDWITTTEYKEITGEEYAW